MSALFLRVFKHLLPNARAWRITQDKTLRKFFEGLSGVAADVREYYDGFFLNNFPQTTSEDDLAEFETQFALPRSGLTIQQRRDRLSATWKALGGQSPGYIQDTLQAAGFDVYVHEWWEPSILHPAGGAVDGDVVPVARDPLDYLDDGSIAARSWLMNDGAAAAQDGDSVAQDGSTLSPSGYPLVNKIVVSSTGIIGDGSSLMMDGSARAQDGGGVVIYSKKQYTIPNDPTKYPFFLYIGGEAFPDLASVPQSRRDEFENLCLKICPAEQWLGILVQYS